MVIYLYTYGLAVRRKKNSMLRDDDGREAKDLDMHAGGEISILGGCLSLSALGVGVDICSKSTCSDKEVCLQICEDACSLGGVCRRVKVANVGWSEYWSFCCLLIATGKQGETVLYDCQPI